jgi:hypothetical protein
MFACLAIALKALLSWQRRVKTKSDVSQAAGSIVRLVA